MKRIITILSFTILLISCGIAQTKTAIPPADLKAQHVLDDPNVVLSWWEPGTPKWLHYGSGDFMQSIGFDAEAIFDVAIKYEPDQLIPFNGMEITQFAFVPAEASATYTIKIWIGEEADSLIYEQLVTSPTINNWNVIDLDSVIIIDSENVTYLGYNVNTAGGYPAGCDAGPAVAPGKCDLIRTGDGNFESLYNYGMELNFNIQAYVIPSVKKGMYLSAINESTTNNAKILQVCKQKAAKLKTFTPPYKSGIADSYNIYRGDEIIANATENTFNDVLIEGGYYKYEVSAVYGDEESIKSNSIEVVYDNMRILPKTIVTEALLCTNEGSPSSPGCYMGMYELNYEFDKLAPIVYHSGTAILGPDPFSTFDSEERFMEYFLISGSFPMALFNGMRLVGGGSGESMYEPYRAAYEDVLNIKTPLDINVELEKVSTTKYKVNVESKVVGIYKDLDLILHVVLTESNIDYEWANGSLNQVNFVARKMFPNYEGTSLNFVGDSLAKASVEIEIDPFVNKSNYKVVAFIQHPQYYTILNGDIQPIPQSRTVYFNVTGENNLPLEGAEVTINDQNKITNESGLALFSLLDNLGMLEYRVNHENYFEFVDTLNMDTASNIQISLLPTSLGSKKRSKLDIYPNPVNNELNITINNASEITIYDITGVKIASIDLSRGANNLDVSYLSKGVYFIHCTNGGYKGSYKIIKN